MLSHSHALYRGHCLDNLNYRTLGHTFVLTYTVTDMRITTRARIWHHLYFVALSWPVQFSEISNMQKLECDRVLLSSISPYTSIYIGLPHITSLSPPCSSTYARSLPHFLATWKKLPPNRQSDCRESGPSGIPKPGRGNRRCLMGFVTRDTRDNLILIVT